MSKKTAAIAAVRALDLSGRVCYRVVAREEPTQLDASLRQRLSTETDALQDTGERFMPGSGGAQIAYEHLHRYLVAATLGSGQRVLDIGSGEGYGSSLLAATAAEVVGVDIDVAAVAHARRTYPRANLRFIVGSGADLAVAGLADGSFDLVVCFEVIEHLREQEALLAGVRAALKPDGLFLVSSPNRLLYGDRASYENPFHVRELYFDEFQTLLKTQFAHFRMFAQNVVTGSAIWPLPPAPPAPSLDVAVRFDTDRRFRPAGEREALYFIAIASNAPLNDRPADVLRGGSQLIDTSLRLREELAEETERLRDLAWKHAEVIESRNRELSETTGTLASLREQEAGVTTMLEQERQRATKAEATSLTLQEAVARLREEQGVLRDEKTALEEQHAERLRLQSEKLNELHRALEQIYASRGWRLLERLWRIKARIDRARHLIKRPRAAWRSTERTAPTREDVAQPGTTLVEAQPPGTQPTISVVIPALDHGRYLRPCIESALGQVPRPREVIIVDDASTDPEALRVLEWASAQPLVRLLRNDGRAGVSRTLNRGVLAATGDYLALVDCDDLLLEGALATMGEDIRNHPDVDFLFSDRIHVDANGQEIARVVYGGGERLLAENGDHAANLMCSMVTSHLKVIRRSALARVGLFSPDVSGCQDYDLALRLTEQSRVRYVPAFLYAHRWHAESVTLSQQAAQHRRSYQVWLRARRRRYLSTAASQPGGEGDGSTVAFVVPFLVVGGAERVLEQLVSRLAVHRRVGVICTLDKGPWFARLAAIPNCTVVSLASLREDPERQVREIVGLVDRWRAAVLHVSNSEAGYRAAVALSARYPRPWIVDTIHSDESGYIRFSERFRPYLDQRIVISHAAARALAGLTGEDPARISVIHNGIPLDTQQLPPATNGTLVAYIGRFSPEKAPLDFIEMAEQVALREPGARFMMVGDGPQRGMVEEVVGARGLERVLSLTGEVDDAASHLAAADVVVLPSRTEGVPMVLLEAMAAARAVVATAVGGVPEVIEHGVHGLLAPPGAPAALADHVVALLQDPDRRRALGAAAAARVGAEFSATRSAVETERVYARAATAGMSDGRSKLISIVILSWNRSLALQRCLESIRSHTRLPYELVVLDNGSSDPRTLTLCRQLGTEPDATVVFEPKNVGCSAGRRRALRLARGDYIVTLDNDIEVQPGWLEQLVLRLEDDPGIGAACCRVIHPDGMVEFTGGGLEVQGVFARFHLNHTGLPASALETLEESDCGWVPGGATIFRRAAIQSAEHSELYTGPYEDNDYSLQLTTRGFRLVNCPLATVVHHHRNFMMESEREREGDYLAARQDPESLRQSLRVFYRRNALIIRDPGAYTLVGLDRLDDDALCRWFQQVEPSAGDTDQVLVAQSLG